MAVYNGERYLEASIESILGQTCRDFEFIIIDDGSQDSSAVLLNRYARGDTRLRVHHQQHSGLVVALNVGCRLAQGKYIARMDADDIAFPDRLQRQLEFLEGNSEVGLLGGACVLINAN